ncbi:single-stranded DNA-binding protein [Pseudanabaena sp. FACHB-2040]|uniref:single-stranded DNA-binding protein n=1 Tax=Pseudanabaena sp. FACHB-2040 TaxID=2692859 RepID=UPI0016879CD3|nr:single-stranded DNA-binding protein [Pseudanabaena sp. FACHB-2040]MBD0269397.1 hypothetical protein [Cyanobacteria bacterium Co-bin8]MBD2256166.1 hypothetical protein [Pseudanabaena sp. FACHB-2040]
MTQSKDPTQLTDLLQQLKLAMTAIAANNPPNWKRTLADYLKPDWPQAIGAIPTRKDRHGPTVLWWMGHYYTRRSGENKKFGAAIWFSRSAGADAEGNARYIRLITFSDAPMPDAEDLPDYVVSALKKATTEQRQ